MGFSKESGDRVSSVLYEDKEITTLNSLASGPAGGSLFASSPTQFAHCGQLKRGTDPSTVFSMTKAGLQIQLPLLEANYFDAGDQNGWVGLLAGSTGRPFEFIGVPLAEVPFLRGSRELVFRKRNSYISSDHRPQSSPSIV